MPNFPITCPACAGTGRATHEDRHAETGPDRCRPCQGTGQIASHTGETREGSFDPETGRALGRGPPSQIANAPPSPVPEPWSRRDIERWLITPMRLLQDGIVALPGNTLEAIDPDRPNSTFDILAFARTVLGKDTPELRAVTTWARIMAAGGNADASIREWCGLWGWKERSFYRRLKRGIDRIVEAKNHADGRVRPAA